MQHDPSVFWGRVLESWLDRLRLGELRALQWRDVDLEKNILHVRRSWDQKEGEIEPKSEAGRREVPILSVLRPYLEAQRDRCAWSEEAIGLVFGATPHRPFSYVGLYRHSQKAWEVAGLPRVTPHQARHSFASFLNRSRRGCQDVDDADGARLRAHESRRLRSPL